MLLFTMTRSDMPVKEIPPLLLDLFLHAFIWIALNYPSGYLDCKYSETDCHITIHMQALRNKYISYLY